MNIHVTSDDKISEQYAKQGLYILKNMFFGSKEYVKESKGVDSVKCVSLNCGASYYHDNRLTEISVLLN